MSRKVEFIFSAGRRGFFFILDDKEANNQGLDLLLDKPFKNRVSAAQVPMKNRQMCAAWLR